MPSGSPRGFRPPHGRALAHLGDGRPGAALVALAAACAFAVQGYVWPLAAGRDWQDYLLYWHEVTQPDPLLPGLMLARTPLAGLFFGPLMDVGGLPLAEAGAGLLYVAAVVLWVAAARRYGRLAAVAVGLLLVFPPTYGLFFRQIGSDPVFGVLLALVTWLAGTVVDAPSTRRFAVLGVAVASLALARPAGQPFLLLALLPLGIAAAWRTRMAWSAALGGTAVALLGAFAVYNGVRFDDYTVARGGTAGIPLYRAFVVDGIVSADNGPASRELAAALRDDLLRREPYRSWGYDPDEFLAAGVTWAFDELPPLADRTWGWDDDYRRLMAVGLEAVRAHPGTYARGVLTTFEELLMARYTGPPGAGWVGDVPTSAVPADGPLGRPAPRLPAEAHSVASVYGIALVNNWALAPSPRYRVTGGLVPRDGVLWSPFETRDLEWVDPEDDRRYEWLRTQVIGYLDQLSDGPRHPRGDPPLRVLMHLTPAIGWWLLAGAVVWLVRRPRGLWPLFLPVLASLVVLLETALGFPGDRNYAAPFLPLAILFAAGVVGRSLAPQRRTRTTSERVATVPARS